MAKTRNECVAASPLILRSGAEFHLLFLPRSIEGSEVHRIRIGAFQKFIDNRLLRRFGDNRHERIEDGMYCASALETLKARVENPESMVASKPALALAA